MIIKTKRIYAEPEANDGVRVLVDRLWPRGLRKEDARIDHWLRDIAPSDGLRKWFAHEPEKWQEFKKRYFDELRAKQELLMFLLDQSKAATVTLLFGAKEKQHNNATALKEYLESQ